MINIQKDNKGFVSLIGLVLALVIIAIMIAFIAKEQSSKNNEGEITPIEQAEDLRDKANKKAEENQRTIEENEY